MNYRNKQYDDTLNTILRASRAKSTGEKYSRAFATWQRWCFSNSVCALPANTDSISRYFVELFNCDAPCSRIEVAFYAIKWHHDCDPNVLNNPCDSKFLHLVLDGIKRLKARPVTKKEPITPDILRSIVFKYGMDENLKNIRLCAICLLAYAGFLRISEVINLRECDINMHPSFVRLFLVKSKTDQYREGAWVIVAATGSVTCPVAMLRKYLLLGNILVSDEFCLDH